MPSRPVTHLVLAVVVSLSNRSRPDRRKPHTPRIRKSEPENRRYATTRSVGVISDLWFTETLPATNPFANRAAVETESCLSEPPYKLWETPASNQPWWLNANPSTGSPASPASTLLQ